MWLTAREEDEAFWNYRDLALFLGLAPPCLLGGAMIVKLAIVALFAATTRKALELLPEGTEVELVPADEGEGLDDADRARLHEALRRSADQFRAGQGTSAKKVLAELGAHRPRLPRRER